MKLLLARQPAHQPQTESGSDSGPENEVLRLAAEILEAEGRCPAIDLAGARLSHWNGAAIALPLADLAELIAGGLLDASGRWTTHGRRALSRHADLKASAA